MKKLIVIVLAVLFTFAFTACSHQPQSPGGDVLAPVNITFQSRGVQVPATLEIPAGDSAFPLVALVHGHGGGKDENIGFVAIAGALKERGIASVRMDFPGCGESTESFRKNTITNMKQDVLNAIAYVTANYPVDTAKVGIFGYSMGGRIVLELLGEGAYNFAAVALLAPANSAGDIKPVFGGDDAWNAMRAAAEKDGFYTHKWMGQIDMELSKEWFADLEKINDPAKTASQKYSGPVLVVYAQDDQAVPPSASAYVAKTLNAEVVDATGDSHSYGFYSDKTDVLNTVVNGVADFFAKTLRKQ